jgi:hypothetical protein
MFNDDWGYDLWGVRNQIWLRTLRVFPSQGGYGALAI